jgi:hypothetical protein
VQKMLHICFVYDLLFLDVNLSAGEITVLRPMHPACFQIQPTAQASSSFKKSESVAIAYCADKQKLNNSFSLFALF